MRKVRVGLYVFISLVILTLASTAMALPKNFRNVDTFYVGAMPSEEDIKEFATLGITTIVSLHRLPPNVKKRAQRMGLNLHSFPLRTRLVNIEEIMEVMRNAPPNSVYLHCLHGADRTGAVTAYWLTTERGLDAFTALASVISPSAFHIRGLEMLGKEYGISLLTPPPEWLGRYSGAKNGGLEGLKVRGNEWYTRLARNFLEVTLGPPIHKPIDKFWDKHYSPRT